MVVSNTSELLGWFIQIEHEIDIEGPSDQKLD